MRGRGVAGCRLQVAVKVDQEDLENGDKMPQLSELTYTRTSIINNTCLLSRLMTTATATIR